MDPEEGEENVETSPGSEVVEERDVADDNEGENPCEDSGEGTSASGQFPFEVQNEENEECCKDMNGSKKN
ncbi:hypothetical protein NDU88_004606 [Pleurodeles waltl]|uniref:Uncharacterized protein n=1 Tax=Pleurodeles waltl TaxID=8319 RepID=A0AAV7M9Q3_PLEWA|nr:hypothetical protein NDU88_004606 [Pleurodeles waltl]